MNTLLLRLSSPLQSWGVQSRFGVRDTGLEPSKSGILGLVCAALGVDREDDKTLSKLSGLRLGVRVDREGQIRVDLHTAKDVLKAGGGMKDTELSNRYYLADALFLVGLEDQELAVLEAIQRALANPVWPLFLGRKAFVPTEPVRLEDGLKDGQDLNSALIDYPGLSHRSEPGRVRLVVEDPAGAIIRYDQPISFGRGRRQFMQRRMINSYINISREGS